MTTEADLLVACLRVGLGCARQDEVEAAATEAEISWRHFVDLAVWHRVPGLARSGLRAGSALDLVPAAVVEALDAAYLETVARNARARAELVRVGAHLAGEGVDVVLLKGAALLETVYADPGLRPMLDMDLLVRQDATARAAAIIEDLGYRPAPRFAALRSREWLWDEQARWPPLVAHDGSLVVELHYRLGGAGTPLGFEVNGMWDRARPCPRMRALLPAPEDLVMHVALHWLLDRRLRSEGALGQLGDLARLLSGSAGAVDWAIVVAQARRHLVGRPLAAALRVVEAVFDSPLLPEAVEDLAPTAIDRPLVAELVARRVFRAEPWVALERLGPRTTTLRQLLPPRPRRIRALTAEARSWRGGLGPYASWAGGAARVVVGMRDVRAELVFGRNYRSLVSRDWAAT